MNAQPLPATPNLAANLGVILRDLAAIIARRLLRHPLHAILIIPLCRHIARTTRRLEHLLARLTAGPLPPPRPRVNSHSGPRHKSPFPTKSAWLVGILGHEAAACASRLEALLAAPDAAELLACTAGRRALAPIRRMLGLTLPRPRRPAPARALAAPECRRTKFFCFFSFKKRRRLRSFLKKRTKKLYLSSVVLPRRSVWRMPPRFRIRRRTRQTPSGRKCQGC